MLVEPISGVDDICRHFNFVNYGHFFDYYIIHDLSERDKSHRMV